MPLRVCVCIAKQVKTCYLKAAFAVKGNRVFVAGLLSANVAVTVCRISHGKLYADIRIFIRPENVHNKLLFAALRHALCNQTQYRAHAQSKEIARHCARRAHACIARALRVLPVSPPPDNIGVFTARLIHVTIMQNEYLFTEQLPIRFGKFRHVGYMPFGVCWRG